MLTNAQMKANRYGKWAASRRLYASIQNAFAHGRIVTVATATKATHYYPKHADMFRCTKEGVYVQHGKRWDCIDYCGFRFTQQ